MVPMNDFIEEYKPKMQGLQDRLSATFDAHGEPKGIMNENDLYEIHSTLFDMQNAVRKKMEQAGAEGLLEQFNDILTALGEPQEPQSLVDVTSETTGMAARSSRVRTMRVRFCSAQLTISRAPPGC